MITWKRLREKKGYTLAELLVVIGIMGVLAAISFVAVNHYRKTLKLLEMDKTAQEIYIAAQNHFTQASTGSKFKEDMKKSLAGGSEINLGTKMTAKPADWDDAEYGSWDDVKDDMYYIQYNCSLGSDSDDLLNDSLLRYVLPYGAIDDTIRKDCQYVIEYNAASDAVYAVYYTDSTDEQLFEEAVLQASAGDTNAWQYRNDPSSGATNRSRTAYNSGKVIIGYYGGGSIVLPYSLSLEENTVVVHNGNRLWAEVYCPVNETKIKDAGILLVDVKVTGEVSGAEKVLSFRVGKDPSEFVKMNNNPVKKSQAITDDEFSAMKLTGFMGFEFVLDDITESDGHFAQIFADADGDEDFIPGEDIRISAESTIADSSTAPKGSNEVVTNSLYSAVEEEAYVTSSNDPVAIKSEYKDKFTTTAKISTFRHLENLDPVISNVKNVSGTFEITQAFLINDITWKSADNKFEYVNDTTQDIYVRSRMRDGHTNGRITDCFSGTYFSAVQGYRGIVTPEL
ncbi:MAG: type II secretion system protein, partial [Lachnospiraceae bacterium]|nr:type II secretion system protein [Lachnospiraceae bacterium]